MAHSLEQFQTVWFAAFGAATVALRDWTPRNCSPDDVDARRRLEAKSLADKAVRDLRALGGDPDCGLRAKKK